MAIALINQKGGVGKTTSAVNIGAALAETGRKVLLIDFDGQTHLTDSVGIDIKEDDLTIYDVLKGKATAGQVIRHRLGTGKPFDVIPSSIDLASADIELAQIIGRELLLKKALASVTGYDYILIDCPPSFGLLTINALVACKQYIITIQPEYFALRGCQKLLEIAEIVKDTYNPELELLGVLTTIYDQRRKIHKDTFTNITEHFGDKMFKTLIRSTTYIAEAQGAGQTIFEYRPGSNGAEDYAAVSSEIDDRIEGRN